jgi:hypothetical protein
VYLMYSSSISTPSSLITSNTAVCLCLWRSLH